VIELSDEIATTPQSRRIQERLRSNMSSLDATINTAETTVIIANKFDSYTNGPADAY